VTLDIINSYLEFSSNSQPYLEIVDIHLYLIWVCYSA